MCREEMEMEMVPYALKCQASYHDYVTISDRLLSPAHCWSNNTPLRIKQARSGSISSTLPSSIAGSVSGLPVWGIQYLFIHRGQWWPRSR